MNYKEIQDLKHRLAVAERSRDFYKLRWEKACAIMSEHEVGIYRYTETAEKKWQRKLDAAIKSLKTQTDIAVHKLHTYTNEHEVIVHTGVFKNNPYTLYLTHGTLFEKLKAKEAIKNNDQNRDATDL